MEMKNKVVTLTANPCIDRTLTVARMQTGATNRVEQVTETVNGKGINTSVAVKLLGFPTLAVVTEYLDGRSVSRYLSEIGIENVAVTANGTLRVNTKVFDRTSETVTEFNCKGCEVSPDLEDRLLGAVLNSVCKGDVLAVSGSVPPGIGNSFYCRIIREANKLGVFTVLDADGELLYEGIKAEPCLVKPNSEELSRLCKRKIVTPTEAANEAKCLMAMGAKAVCVSLGADGAVLVGENAAYYAPSAKVAVRGTVGAGDSMVAGFAISALMSEAPEEALRSAMAVAAGSVSLPGTRMCDAELYTEMLRCINIQKL